MKKTLALFLICSIGFNINAEAGDYPKTKLERQMDEMGSFVGTDGLGFTLRRVKDQSTKQTIGNVNKYLYMAAKQTLEDAPIIIDDTQIGVLITDWHYQEQTSAVDKNQVKIAVIIKDVVINPNAIEVKLNKRIKKGKNWQALKLNEEKQSRQLENKIIRLARDLYIKDKINK